MIRVDRSEVERPADLEQPAARSLDGLWRFFQRGATHRSQHRYPFEPEIWQAETVREALWRLFHRKCAFCECRFASHQDLEVAHLRPPEKTSGVRKGQIAADHYWWLAYRWENLYPICRLCNRYKRNSFPVNRARPEMKGLEGLALSRLLRRLDRQLSREEPLLLDPCGEQPEPCLEYDHFGKIRGKSLRAEVTIEVLGLNRPELVGKRRRIFAEGQRATRRWQERLASQVDGGEERADLLRQLFTPLAEECAATREMAGLRRQLALRALARLKLQVSDAPPDLDVTALQAAARTAARRPRQARCRELKRRRARVLGELRSIWITSIELANFKGIHNLAMDFPPAQSGKDPWLMLIGTNGSGKSSILQAIALALVSPTRRRMLVPDASVCMNHSTKEIHGRVLVHFNTGDTVELGFGKYSPKFQQKGLSRELKALKILGFGSTRLPPPRKRHGPRKRLRVLVDNLFDPHRPLADPEWWLTDTDNLSTLRFNRLQPALRDLLCLGEEVRFSRRHNTLYLHQFGTRYSLRESSDGYQTVVALAAEIVRKLSASECSVDDVEGTVLLDEIEVHLHPSWKVRIVSTLRKIFPHVRFIVTTHDPLCLRGLEEDEICLLERDDEGRVHSQAVSVPAGLRADQLLTGEWFGLSSTLDDDTLRLMEEHGRLLIKEHKTRSDTRQQHRIEDELRARFGSFAETALDRLALGVAAEEMRKRRPEKLSTDRRKEVKSKIEDRMRLVGV